MKITNTSAVIQRLKATNGKIVEIMPGESKDVSIDGDDPAVKAKVRARNIVLDAAKTAETKAVTASK